MHNVSLPGEPARRAWFLAPRDPNHANWARSPNPTPLWVLAASELEARDFVRRAKRDTWPAHRGPDRYPGSPLGSCGSLDLRAARMPVRAAGRALSSTRTARRSVRPTSPPSLAGLAGRFAGELARAKASGLISAGTARPLISKPEAEACSEVREKSAQPAAAAARVGGPRQRSRIGDA